MSLSARRITGRTATIATIATVVVLMSRASIPVADPALEVALVIVRSALVACGAYVVVVSSLDVIVDLTGLRAGRRALRRVVAPALRGVLVPASAAAMVIMAGGPASASPNEHAVIRAAPPGASDEVATITAVDLPPEPEPRIEPADVPTQETVVVASGDCLWDLALDRLAASGQSTTDADVARLVERFVDANRDRLADPSNPDLLFVGQELVLPATAP